MILLIAKIAHVVFKDVLLEALKSLFHWVTRKKHKKRLRLVLEESEDTPTPIPRHKKHSHRKETL